MSDEFIVWFENYVETDRERVGGKVASLGELIAAELPVPPGYAVTTAAYENLIRRVREQSLAVMHEGSVSRELLEGFGQPGWFGGEPETKVDFAQEGSTQDGVVQVGFDQVGDYSVCCSLRTFSRRSG